MSWIFDFNIAVYGENNNEKLSVVLLPVGYSFFNIFVSKTAILHLSYDKYRNWKTFYDSMCKDISFIEI